MKKLVTTEDFEWVAIKYRNNHYVDLQQAIDIANNKFARMVSGWKILNCKQVGGYWIGGELTEAETTHIARLALVESVQGGEEPECGHCPKSGTIVCDECGEELAVQIMPIGESDEP